MMRTLIALLAAAALSLPAQAQQTGTQQGPEQGQNSRTKAQSMERGAAGSQRSANQDRNRRGSDMDRAGRMAGREDRSGQRAGGRFRGRTGYYERRRGGRVYGEYERGSSEIYAGGRRVYGRACPRYIYIEGRRVLNERCLGYRTGRRTYFRGYEGGPRYYSRERSSFSATEYGNRRGRAGLGGRTSARDAGRNRGERAGMNARGQASGQAGQAAGSRGNRASRSARNRPGTQTQGESQPGAR